MKLPRRRFLHLAAGAAALSLVPRLARAQAYPTRPITIIVPFAAGGPTDVIGRVVAEGMRASLGQPIIIENVTGAGGSIGVGRVARAAPDGYTIYLGFHGTNSVLQHLDAKLPYNPEKDFAPVVFLATGPTVLVVHPSVPAKTVQELIALARTKPGGLSYASAGIGTTPHLVAEQFKLYTGTDITGVQYRGAAPANQDVLAGHVPMTFDLIGNAMNNIKEGKFRALGLTARQRSPLLPDVPTMQEAGLPEMEAGAWFGFFAPAGTPRAAIDWLNREANAIFTASDVSSRFTGAGMSLPLGSPESLGNHVEADSKRWSEVIRKGGIKLQ